MHLNGAWRVHASHAMLNRLGHESHGQGWTCRWWMLGPACFITVVLGAALLAQPARPVVNVVPITGAIDLGLAPFVSRVREEAAEAQATAVILDITTFGGRVDAAIFIRDALLQARVCTIAFVNKGGYMLQPIIRSSG
jgi:membrane-bound ClpP family serine protease